MKPEQEITERLASYLDEIEKAVQSTTAFAAEQAPMVVQEFLAWEFWSNSIIAAVLGVVAAILSALVFGICRSKWDDCEDQASAIIWLSALFVVCLVPCGMCAYCAAKVKIAPRIVLIEKVAELTKRGR